MGTIAKLLTIPGAKLQFATIEEKKSNGMYAVRINGKRSLAKSTVDGALQTGRRVVISVIENRSYITDKLTNYQNTNARTVIIDG